MPRTLGAVFGSTKIRQYPLLSSTQTKPRMTSCNPEDLGFYPRILVLKSIEYRTSHPYSGDQVCLMDKKFNPEDANPLFESTAEENVNYTQAGGCHA